MDIRDTLQRTTKTQLKAAILKQSFELFVKEMWAEVDPEPLQWSWSMSAICTCLQAVSEGRIRKLIISVPPGCAKSLLVSVCWQAYQWAKDPAWSMMSCSASLNLCYRDSQRFHDLISSEKYLALFGDSFKMTTDANSLGWRKNDRGGERKTVSVGNGTGFRATCQIIDDPLTADDAKSEAAREAAKYWISNTLSNRYRNQSKGIRVVIAQRLHEDDCSGVLLKTGEYQHLCLPTEYDPARRCVVKDLEGKVVFEDPRNTPGELMLRYGFGPEENEQAKRDLQSYGYAAQQQQSPVPAGGGWIRRDWFSQCHSPNQLPGTIPTPTNFDKIAIVVDASVKDNPDCDRACIIVAGIKNHNAYILDAAWDRMTIGPTIAAIKNLKIKWNASEVAIEDKANGSPIITEMRSNPQYRMGCPIISLKANAPKDVRIQLAVPYIEGQHIFLPGAGFQSSPLNMSEFLDEICAYPKAPHDDAPDALAHLVARYCTHTTTDKYAAMVALQSLQGR